MFTANKFALQRISHQGFRSFVFFFLIFIATICLFGTGIITDNMQSGIKQTGNQIGADIVVVPAGYDGSAKEALFHGKACTMLFQENVTEQIGRVEGVKEASAQLYMKTLPKTCCAAGGVQMIAIDPATDFNVGRWLKGKGIESLGKNEMIVGASSGLNEGEEISFFAKKFQVTEVLEETGMGYDESAFISYEAANEITADKEYQSIFGERTELSSMVMVSVKDGYNPENVRKKIADQITDTGISAYATDELVKDLTKQLHYFKNLGILNNAFVIILASVSLLSLVTITFHQQRNQVGSLLSVGIGKKKIIQVFLTEYLYLLLAGTVAGIVLVCIFVFPLHTVIKNALDIPYRFIGAPKTLLLAVKTILINFVMVILAASLSFFRILKYEPAILAEVQE